MMHEMMGGRPEQEHRRSFLHAYYFGGIMMTSSHLEPIRQTMLEIYNGVNNVTILSSSLSKDLPPPRKKDVAFDIETRLQKGQHVKLICHSLGAVEAMRVLRAVSLETIEQHADQLSIDLISPAGLFSNPKGMVEFLRRFVDNSVLREKIRPTVRRGFESLAIYPPEGMREFTEVIRVLFPEWQPATVQGKQDQMEKRLKLDREVLENLRIVDEDIRIATDLHDKELLEKALTKRGRLLLPSIIRFQLYKEHPEMVMANEKPRLHFGHFTEAGKIVTRLLTGKTNETLRNLYEQKVAVRFVYLAQDPIVLKQDIMDFFGTEDWGGLVRSQRVIPVGDLGHSSHVILPDVLRFLTPSLP